MSRLMMLKLIIHASLNDPIMVTGSILMLNGIFYSVASSIFGVDVVYNLYSNVLHWMYILVLPAHILLPKTVEAEIV